MKFKPYDVIQQLRDLIAEYGMRCAEISDTAPSPDLMVVLQTAEQYLRSEVPPQVQDVQVNEALAARVALARDVMALLGRDKTRTLNVFHFRHAMEGSYDHNLPSAEWLAPVNPHIEVRPSSTTAGLININGDDTAANSSSQNLMDLLPQIIGDVDESALSKIEGDPRFSSGASWTLLKAVQFYAQGKHFADENGLVRLDDAGAVAREAIAQLAFEHKESRGVPLSGTDDAVKSILKCIVNLIEEIREPKGGDAVQKILFEELCLTIRDRLQENDVEVAALRDERDKYKRIAAYLAEKQGSDAA